MIYHCCDPRRRERVLQAIADGMSINGIDFIEVLDREAPPDTARQTTLLLRFLDAAPALSLSQFELTGGERTVDVTLEWVTRADAPVGVEPGLAAYLAAMPDPDQVLVLHSSSTGDFSTYTLRLVDGPGDLAPPAGIDRVLSQVAFSFKVECPSDFDCAPLEHCPDAEQSPPVLSYLARDYQSFRRLMLGRMAQVMPDWRERNPGDLGVTLVEALAYTADRLAYAQDAVGTEAYLATARRRSSVRRHARLVDYHMHDGANARAWVHFDVSDDIAGLPAGTQLLSRLQGFDPVIAPGDDERDAFNRLPEVFETLHEADLFAAHNAMDFYEWSDAECCLPKGATRATLAGDFPDLAVGDVLIVEERVGPRTGRPADADPSIRHAVRLTAVQSGIVDDLTSDPLTEMRWAEEDALPFPLCISSTLDEAAGGGLQRRVSHVLGNIVLADHGRTIEDEDLGTVPRPHLQLVPDGGGAPCDRPEPRNVPPRFRPCLLEGPVSLVAPYDAAAPSAFAAMSPPFDDRRHAVTLTSGVAPMLETWQAQRDLLQSLPEQTHFVVETESDQSACLRFGDGRNGRRPVAGTNYTANYRVGNGQQGNLGGDALSHVITGFSQITAIRNPMPAIGGINGETMEEVRQAAPYAYRRQERAVTPDDYARMAEKFRDVQRAAATFRWNGHGYTVFVTVDRLGNRPVTPEFEAELRDTLNAVRMAGYDMEVDAPRFVSLEISLFVCARPDHFRTQVRQDVLRVLSAGRLADGALGFFHPDNLTFGTPVHLSAIYAAVMGVEGVASVEARHFRRRGTRGLIALADGVLEFGRLEIARLENDRNFPEHGSLEIEMGGGK